MTKEDLICLDPADNRYRVNPTQIDLLSDHVLEHVSEEASVRVKLHALNVAAAKCPKRNKELAAAEVAAAAAAAAAAAVQPPAPLPWGLPLLAGGLLGLGSVGVFLSTGAPGTTPEIDTLLVGVGGAMCVVGIMIPAVVGAINCLMRGDCGW